MGLEIYVFVWWEGNVVEGNCSVFYFILIIEKEEILDKCWVIGVDGVILIVFDLVVLIVNYVVYYLNLVVNFLFVIFKCINKFVMRVVFEESGLDVFKY